MAAAMLITGCNKKENKKVENQTPAFEPRFSVSKSNDSNTNDSDKPKEPSTNGLQIPDSKYEEIIKKSLVTKGNNALVNRFLQKCVPAKKLL